MIIAVDGTAASGKGTLARRLAGHYRLPHLDTGLLYRAVGRKMLDQGSDLSDQAAAIVLARNFAPAWLVDGRLRGNEASVAASRVASIPEVRKALLEFQQRFARQPGGAVLDGRDIGTVIAPEAEVKSRKFAPTAVIWNSNPSGPTLPKRPFCTSWWSATAAMRRTCCGQVMRTCSIPVKWV